MTTSFNSISHSFLVTDISLRGVPAPNPIFNEFDYFGSLLGLKRLPEEKNASYKARLLDVFTHRASSTYTGLINGMTRELGLDLYSPISISLRTGLDPSWSPRIEFIDNVVYIWRDITTQTLDKSINRGTPADAGYFISGLLNEINTSSVFTATLNESDKAWTRSDCIVNQSSSKLVQRQLLVNSRSNYLGIGNIDRGSLVFSDTDTFSIEVSTANAVTSTGKYFVNYSSGLLKSFNIPKNNSSIQYSYLQTPFLPIASPIIIRSFNSQEFQSLIFNQSLQSDGTSVNGIPTSLGAEIINELLSVTPLNWGP